MAMTASRGGGILTVGVGYKFRNNSMRKSEPKSAHTVATNRLASVKV